VSELGQENPADTLIYLQTMGGLAANIFIPSLDSWKDSINVALSENKKLAINKAEIVFHVDTLLSDLKDLITPGQLLLTYLDQNGESVVLSDYSLSPAYFGGYLNRSDATYRFNITNHLQDIIEHKKINNKEIENNGFRLTTAFRNTLARRVVLKGSKSKSDSVRGCLFQIEIDSCYRVSLKQTRLCVELLGTSATKMSIDPYLRITAFGISWLRLGGIAIFNGDLNVYKCKGRVSDLENHVADKDTGGHVGIGHTRWATHGEPNDRNAHPHTSMNGNFVLVHNGIIENYAELKTTLQKKGFTFQSDTDTEVLVNLIEYFYQSGEEMDAETAVRLALSKVVGAYGIVVFCKNEKNRLIAARKGSPLVIGLGRGEYFIASDASPIVEYTDSVIYLNDLDVAIINKDSLTLKTVENAPVPFKVTKVDMSIGDLEKGDFDHFMLKEIFEQPKTIEDTFRGRIKPDHSDIVLGGLLDIFPKIMQARRIILIGCGTSWHAALVGEYMIEEYARVPVEVEYASEFRYRNPILDKNDVVIAISQSGETADTLAALRMAKEKGATILGICNVVGSSISRETDAGVYTHAGLKSGASTKAFTAQVTVLTLFALKLAKEKGQIALNCTGHSFMNWLKSRIN
jgi:D-arabinose 5-phosphate isomerase GutQ